jgi:pimeloyl-ACP methyl ester carboxylesterase
MFRRVGEALINTVSFGSGDTVVFGVGGWIGNWELWQQPFEVLSRQGFRTIAYDHYGSGETIAPSHLLTFEAHINAVFRLLDDLGIETCVLAGESMGGTVAIEAARRSPARFHGVVVVGSAVHGFDDQRTQEFAAALRKNHEATMRFFVDLCIPEPDAEHLKRWLLRILLRTPVEDAVTLLEAMYGLDLRPRLGELEVPVQFVHGELDALPNNAVADAEATAGAVRDARFHIVRGAGHVPTLTRPFEVAEVMAAFIRDLDLR